MLKKQNRLDKVQLGKSQAISSPLLVIKYSENQLSFNRFAFVISKKIDKKAVVRNSLKRKLSICLEEIFDNINTGYDFVLYPRISAVEADQTEVLESIKKLLEQEKLLK